MTLDAKTQKALFASAVKASENSYSPYSHLKVGASLLMEDGSFVTGCNVENRSFGLTNCAERTALFKAISMGKKVIKAIAIATPQSDFPVSPCGACRQVLTEFAPPDTPVIFGCTLDATVQTTLGQLFPQDSLHELKVATRGSV